MEFLKCSVLVFIFPSVGLTADASLDLPAEFSEEPGCVSSTICLADGIPIFHDRYYDAIAVAALDDGNPEQRILNIVPNPLDENEVTILIGYQVAAHKMRYRLEMKGGQWVIKESSLLRE
jgi:hypothetical protein